MVERHEGRVVDVELVDAGSTSSTFLVAAETRKLFVKTVPDVPRAQIEVRVQPFLPPCAPRMRWKTSTGDRLVLGFDYIKGRHADLRYGSPDLPRAAQALTELSAWRADLPVLPVEKRWQSFCPEPLDALAGDTLVHTDLCAENILIGDRVWIVDWAWPTRGAAWLDTASMVARLIQDGHSATEAHTWGLSVPAFRSAHPAAIRLHAEVRAELCRRRGYPLRDAWSYYLDYLS